MIIHKSKGMVMLCLHLRENNVLEISDVVDVRVGDFTFPFWATLAVVRGNAHRLPNLRYR